MRTQLETTQPTSSHSSPPAPASTTWELFLDDYCKTTRSPWSLGAVLIFGRRFRQYACRGYLIAFLQVDEPNSLRRAASLPDLVRPDADHLAILRHNHQLGIFLHRKDPDHHAVARRRLHIDDALAAAVGQPVFFDRSPLAVAVLGGSTTSASSSWTTSAPTM